MTTSSALQTITRDDMWKLWEQASNWGRWGADDERGTLNLITDQKRSAAVRLAKDGVSVSLSLPLATRPAPDNPTPVQHHMTRAGDAQHPDAEMGGAADYFSIAPHGLSNTHLDALCHIFVRGKMYNGFSQAEVRSNGAHKDSIMAGADGIVSRGVFLDIPALRGVEWLEPGAAVTASELAAAEQRQHVRVEPGDILWVGTGRDARRTAMGRTRSPQLLELAGLYADCVPWLRERDIAVLGNDGVSDISPSSGVEGWSLPIHQTAIPAMGVHLVDNADLSRLAAACRERGRYEFLSVIAPLRLERGTAVPVNPLAIF